MKDTSMELLAEMSWWYPRTMQAIAIVSWLLTWTWRYDPTAENTMSFDHRMWKNQVGTIQEASSCWLAFINYLTHQ